MLKDSLNMAVFFFLMLLVWVRLIWQLCLPIADGRTCNSSANSLESNNPASWKNVFLDFNKAADYESLGKLDDIIKKGFQNIPILL